MLQQHLYKLMMASWCRYLVLGAVLAMLAVQIAQIFWRYYPIPAESGVYVSGSQVSNSSSRSEKPGYDQLANAIANVHLFGKAEVAVVEEVVVEEAPETRLNYKLRGIYFSTDQELSSAIVEVKPNKSNFYRINDELDDKITLASIEADHILIDRYGKLERLNLEKKASLGKDRDSAAKNLPGTINTTVGSAESTALLQGYKKRYVNNPLALARRFQAIPVTQDGKNVGYKLKALRGESLLKKLNFQESDVFVKINGIGLDKPFQALDAVKSLSTASNVSVTVLRNGTEETLDFNM